MTEATKQIAQRSVDMLYEPARQMVAAGKEHQPMIALEWRNGQRDVAVLVGMDKNFIAALHREAAKRPEVAAVTLISEAWMFSAAAGDEKGEKIAHAVLDGKIQVADIPGRSEILLFNIRVGADQFLCRCPIDRTAKTLTKGELIDLSEGERRMEGRFVGDGQGEARRRAN